MTAVSLPSQLESILRDAKRAFDAGIYYPALSVALTLPDICVSLGYEERKTRVQRDAYVAWVDRYAPIADLQINGDVCYKFRCGVIHSGNVARHAFLGADAIMFSVPETGDAPHNICVGGALSTCLVLEQFLAVMFEGVARWYEEYRADETVARNLSHLLSWHPEGIPPFLEGAPVIGSRLK